MLPFLFLDLYAIRVLCDWEKASSRAHCRDAAREAVRYL